MFVYDLPARFTACPKPGWASYNYGTEERLPQAGAAPVKALQPDSADWRAPQALREDGRFLTADPKAADLFLVPALFYCARCSEQLNFTGRQRPCCTDLWQARACT